MFPKSRSGVLLQPVAASLAVAVLLLGPAAPAAAAPDPGDTHTVERGDTLSEIADWYDISLSTLLDLNGLDSSALIHPGDVILLSGEAAEEDPPAEESSTARTHTVRSGDTLLRIADAYDVSLGTVLELNGLDRSSTIYPGDVLLLSDGEAPDEADPPEEKRSPAATHIVRSGDTLGRIADAYDVSLDTVLELNGLDRSSTIYPGDVVVLPAGGADRDADSEDAPGPGLETGPNSTSRVILTYDDCPDSLAATEEVLAFAERSNIGLVIAPTGDCIRSFESRYGVDLADRARAHGQYVINHSVSHRDLTTLSCDDAADELGAPGVVTNYGRPPYGALNSAARCGYAQVGMSPWLWSVDTRDWTGKSEAEVVARVVERARPGSTVLMHLQWNGFSPSAIEQMQEGLAARGVELCRAHPGTSPVDLPPSLPC